MQRGSPAGCRKVTTGRTSGRGIGRSGSILPSSNHSLIRSVPSVRPHPNFRAGVGFASSAARSSPPSGRSSSRCWVSKLMLPNCGLAWFHELDLAREPWVEELAALTRRRRSPGNPVLAALDLSTYRWQCGPSTGAARAAQCRTLFVPGGLASGPADDARQVGQIDAQRGRARRPVIVRAGRAAAVDGSKQRIGHYHLIDAVSSVDRNLDKPSAVRACYGQDGGGGRGAGARRRTGKRARAAPGRQARPRD